MSGVFYDAAAGSGKTTYLVRLAAEQVDGHVLFTTFTDENTNEIRQIFVRELGRVPENVDIVPWYSFILREGVRPFQGEAGFGDEVFAGIKLVSSASALRTRKGALAHYAFRRTDGCRCIYSDKVAELALFIDERSGGRVFSRLSQLYSLVCIDEVQDMSGYDLEFIAALIDKAGDVRLAGDLRQSTYHTSNVAKNKIYREKGFGQFARDRHLDCSVDSETLRTCHRCPQQIVDLADALYPDFPLTISSVVVPSNDSHVGVFVVKSSDAMAYSIRYGAVCLVYDKRTKVPLGIRAKNMGAVKGKTFDRVLIFPTSKMKDWLFDHEARLEMATRAKLYVAITRARLSVTFVVPDSLDGNLPQGLRVWSC